MDMALDTLDNCRVGTVDHCKLGTVDHFKLGTVDHCKLGTDADYTLSSVPWLLCSSQACACLAPLHQEAVRVVHDTWQCVCVQAHCLHCLSSTLEIANLCNQAEGVTFVLQVFGLLDMHEQLDGHMSVLSEVLSNTNSGSLLRVSQQ